MLYYRCPQQKERKNVKKYIGGFAVVTMLAVGCVGPSPNTYGGVNEVVNTEEGKVVSVYDSSDVLKCSYLVRNTVNMDEEKLGTYDCEDGQGIYDD